jgi:hypothetical protein
MLSPKKLTVQGVAYMKQLNIYKNGNVVSSTLEIYHELYYVFRWNNLLYFGLTKGIIF